MMGIYSPVSDKKAMIGMQELDGPLKSTNNIITAQYKDIYIFEYVWSCSSVFQSFAAFIHCTNCVFLCSLLLLHPLLFS